MRRNCRNSCESESGSVNDTKGKVYFESKEKEIEKEKEKEKEESFKPNGKVLCYIRKMLTRNLNELCL